MIALLGILFVAGAALLNQVTFSTSALQAARQTRETESAVDAVEDMVLGWLGEGFIGPDGVALNPKSRYVAHIKGDPNTPCVNSGDDCVLALPQVVETPGVTPWLDVLEPINPDVTGFTATLQYKLYSNPAFALIGRPGVNPDVATNPNLIGATVDVTGNVGSTWDVNDSGDSVLELPRDADGDGIVDSFQFPLPSGVLPIDIQRDLADRLRDPNYKGGNPTSNRDPDQLWISLRIIPHGAMLDLNTARDSMVNYLLDPGNTSFVRPANRYSPQVNEWYLRHRGLMLPRMLPRTRLIEDYASYLLPAHEWPRGTNVPLTSLMTDPTRREWWGFDFATDAAGAGSVWTDMIADPTQSSYDLVHDVTTINYDDQLMRPARTAAGQDVIEAMRAADGASPWTNSDTFALDNYPAKLDVRSSAGVVDDPRLGRLKVSFPELDELLKANTVLLKDLSLPTPQSMMAKQRIVRTIQEALLLMLHNVADLNGDGSPNQPDDAVERAVTAAMLTANLIDFADADPAGEPTAVSVVDLDTTGSTLALVPVLGSDGTTPLVVYGFERQPFITEVYASFVPSANPSEADPNLSSFAIELYNPYPVALPLANYRLKEIAPPGVNFFAGAGVPPTNPTPLDEDLTSQSIPPNGYLTVFSLADPNPTGAKLDSNDDWAVDQQSVIGLYRTITNGPEILVDVFDVGSDVVPSGPTDLPDPVGNQNVRSWERDNSEWAPGESKWRFVVPRAGEDKSAVPAQHTLGAINTYTDPAIFSVHLDVANHVRFEQAIPTTGTLLLLSRMAHVFDGSTGPSTWTAPFNRVNTPAKTLLTRTIATDYQRPDNGRLPLFDNGYNPMATPPAPAYRDASAYGMPGAVEGIGALPWGQLVFDYFTALPLQPCDPSNFTCDPDKILPRVDQEGLRVHGRININAAPWVVIASAPTFKLSKFPAGYRGDLGDAVLGSRTANQTTESQLGDDLAKAIVWYREAIKADTNRDYEDARDPYSKTAPPASAPFAPRQGYGYLTVGELLNVTAGVSVDSSRMDAGAIGRGPDDQRGVYERAVGRMVAMGDWLTTRSHVFTVYGVIRGQFNDDSDPAKLESSLRATDQRAIRFQTTVDRLPMFFGRNKPERIGARVLGGYADVRAD